MSAAAEPRRVRVRDLVVFHDQFGVPSNALVTTVWSETCVNVVIVSSDEAKEDSYGRQIERHTSLVHKSQQSAHGQYWRFSDEEPNAYVAPIE